MTKAVTYRGFTIQPTPRHLAEIGMWGLSLRISWTTKHNEQIVCPFFTADVYATEDEAATLSIAYGKLIIDGKIPGSSVG